MLSFDNIVVPLPSDAAFLQLLSQALGILSKLYADTLQQGIAEVRAVAESVSKTAKPQSEKGVSDLNTWRAIFQLWIESDIFESRSEQKHGEVPVAEAELRLERFAKELESRNLMDAKALRLPESREALKRFLALNLSILNLKKVRGRIQTVAVCSPWRSSNLPMPKQSARSSRSTRNGLLYHPNLSCPRSA